MLSQPVGISMGRLAASDQLATHPSRGAMRGSFRAIAGIMACHQLVTFMKHRVADLSCIVRQPLKACADKRRPRHLESRAQF